MDTSGFAHKNVPNKEKETVDSPRDIVSTISNQKLLFNSLAVEINRHLLQERQKIRDKNRKDLLNRFTDITGEISCCEIPYSISPDIEQRRIHLERIKQDLETRILELDEKLWQDTALIRKDLLEAKKKLASTKLRMDLVSPRAQDGSKQAKDSTRSRPVPGSWPNSRRTDKQ